MRWVCGRIFPRPGLKGIEVWHTKHSVDETDKFKKMADKLGMIMTGGSDCHGVMNDEPPIMGNIKVPYSAVIELKKYKNNLEKNHSHLFS